MSSAKRDTLMDSITSALMRWQDATQAFDEAVGEKLELGSAERHCLSFLHQGPQTAGAIAKAVGLTPAAVTALIDRLEMRGLVERRRSDKDRRQVHVVLTDAAMTMGMKYYGPIARDGAAVLEAMTTAELETINYFFAKALALQQRHTDKIRMTFGKTGVAGRKPRAKG